MNMCFATRRTAWTAWFTGVAMTVLVIGCRVGGGTVEVASLNFRAIDPPPARVARLALSRCYWWLDEADRVNVAVAVERAILWGGERFNFLLHLQLDELPAGRGRTYRLERNQLRAAATLGPLRGRYVSIDGVAVVTPGRGGRLEGSFRIQAAHESLVLLGWSGPSRRLVLGTFEAVRNPERGREIADWILEVDGRAAPPASTQPAPTQ